MVTYKPLRFTGLILTFLSSQVSSEPKVLRETAILVGLNTYLGGIYAGREGRV